MIRLAIAGTAAVLTLGLTGGAGWAAEQASAAFISTNGEEIGQASITEGPGGILVTLKVDDLPEGVHAIHFHDVGDCGDPDAGFKASGGHINPDDQDHGLLNADGPHPGDLPNIYISKEGSVEAELFSPFLTLSEDKDRVSLLDDDGSALVIHEGADDHMSQPVGGAGDRLACAVVEAADGDQ